MYYIWKKLRCAAVAAVVVLALSLTGCTMPGKQEEAVQEEVTDKLQIGMSFDSFVIERWLRDRDLFVMTAKDLGADVNVQVANGNAKEQAEQIRYFIRKDVDVIVVIAVDGSALSDVVEEAREKGIRVVSYDRLIMGTATDLYISFDNERVGELMGEALAAALPDGGNIFAIYGSPTDQNVAMVQKGLHSVIDGSSLNIVYSNYCANWLAELAFDAVEEGLATTPRNLVGVMCGNDDLASQAFRALAENRLAGKVALVGQDAELSACQRIVEGTQTMTVFKPVELLAKRAAEYAVALGYAKMSAEDRIAPEDVPDVARERLEEFDTLDLIDAGSGAVLVRRSADEGSSDSDNRAHATAVQVREDGEAPASQPEWQDEAGNTFSVSVMGDGTVTVQEEELVPYYALEPVAVTAENMDEVIIGSDFHTREDVYLNVD